MKFTYLVINAAMFILQGIFLKNFLPSYLNEKGKNLATKEDIQEITRKTEEVQKEFKQDFELFSTDVQFKYDFYYKQYGNLYCKLYAIVVQSEYVRQFIKISKGQEISFNEAPFLEMSKTHRISQKIEIKEGSPTSVTQSEKEIETPISEFNKKLLCDCIIDKGELASQKLLKLAVSYRLAYNYYSGNPDVKNSSCSNVADEEEFKLIREIVCCIVSEYNYLRKELKMDYNEEELITGIPTL